MNKTIESITNPIQVALDPGNLYQLICWPIQDCFTVRIGIRTKRLIMDPHGYVPERLWFVDLCDILRDVEDNGSLEHGAVTPE
jgi:hypothetical protein